MPFRKRDPALAAAQRTVREAFEDLEKTVSPADSKGFEATTLENVQKAALEIENQLAARQSLRNMRRLMPLFSGLDYYSRTIEVLCNGTPYLSWIWAPIKLILKISSDYVDAFEQIVKAYSRIGESLTRFKLLSETFSKNTEFQQTFAVFYADILRFHKEAYKFVRRSSWRVFFLTSWGQFQRRFDNILEDLARHEQQIDKEANAHDIYEARNTRKALEEWRQESLSKVKKEEEEQNARQLEAICSWLKKNETDQLLIFDRISTEGSNHSGTCSWVLEHPKLSAWLRADQSDITFIWLQGNPGTGKSIIAGQLVKFLNASHRSLVVSHFSTYSYASSTQYDEILKSLLFQLVRANSDVAAHIYGGYAIERKSIGMSVLEHLLQTSITALVEDLGRQQTIHMIIDGLDEVEADKQRRLINLMNSILKSMPLHGATFKVLLSSRRSQVLDKVLRKKPTVSLSDEKNRLEHAIRTYAGQRLKAQSFRLSQLGLQDRDFIDIGESIAEKADGMFLWARLVLDYLTHNMFYSSQEIWGAINTLPRKLAEFYERVLVQIMSNFDSRSVARMRSIFGWIAFAERPLRKFELRSALSFSTGDPKVDEPVPLYIFDMGMPLIEERLDSTLTFIHVSVKDYLQMPESKLPIVRDKEIYEHALASTACLLSGLEVFNVGFPNHERTVRVLKGSHGFHVYANEYWVDYVLGVLPSGNSQSQLCNLPTTLQELSNILESLEGSSIVSKKANESIVSENRLNLIKEYPGLYKNAKIAIQARSQKVLDGIYAKEEYPTADLQPVHELKDALANYQKTIRSLLLLRDFPGVSKEDLERFQGEYCTTVFTCRLSSCPRATIGFESDALRLQHEATHTPCLKCPFHGCQYPPFVSARALKSHEAKCHAAARDRKRIRRVDSRINKQIAFNAGPVARDSDFDSDRNQRLEPPTVGEASDTLSQWEIPSPSFVNKLDIDKFLTTDRYVIDYERNRIKKDRAQRPMDAIDFDDLNFHETFSPKVPDFSQDDGMLPDTTTDPGGPAPNAHALKYLNPAQLHLLQLQQQDRGMNVTNNHQLLQQQAMVRQQQRGLRQQQQQHDSKPSSFPATTQGLSSAKLSTRDYSDQLTSKMHSQLQKPQHNVAVPLESITPQPKQDLSGSSTPSQQSTSRVIYRLNPTLTSHDTEKTNSDLSEEHSRHEAWNPLRDLMPLNPVDPNWSQDGGGNKRGLPPDDTAPQYNSQVNNSNHRAGDMYQEPRESIDSNNSFTHLDSLAYQSIPPISPSLVPYSALSIIEAPKAAPISKIINHLSPPPQRFPNLQPPAIEKVNAGLPESSVTRPGLSFPHPNTRVSNLIQSDRINWAPTSMPPLVLENYQSESLPNIWNILNPDSSNIRLKSKSMLADRISLHPSSEDLEEPIDYPLRAPLIPRWKNRNGGDGTGYHWDENSLSWRSVTL